MQQENQVQPHLQYKNLQNFFIKQIRLKVINNYEIKIATIFIKIGVRSSSYFRKKMSNSARFIIVDVLKNKLKRNKREVILYIL